MHTQINTNNRHTDTSRMQRLRRNRIAISISTPPSSLCLLFFYFILFISFSNAQNACPLKMVTYTDQSACENARDSPNAQATLYATSSCLATDIDFVNSPTKATDLPGNYVLRCLDSTNDDDSSNNYGKVEFEQSGCVNSDCSGTSDYNSNLCLNDISQVGAFFAILDPPKFELQPADSNTWFCYTVRGSAGSVTFAILGDCRPCMNSNPTPTSPTVNVSSQPPPTPKPVRPPTPKPVRPPTPKPVRPPTPKPVVPPTPRPSPEPTPIPTQSPTFRLTPRPTIRVTPRPVTPGPTPNPTSKPTTSKPTLAPTPGPTPGPTPKPTGHPTTPAPTNVVIVPTKVPSDVPTMVPTLHPTVLPTVSPTATASSSPTILNITTAAVTTIEPTVELTTNTTMISSTVAPIDNVTATGVDANTTTSGNSTAATNDKNNNSTTSTSNPSKDNNKSTSTTTSTTSKDGSSTTTTDVSGTNSSDSVAGFGNDDVGDSFLRTDMVPMQFYLLDMPDVLNAVERSKWASVTATYIRESLDRRRDLKKIDISLQVTDQAFVSESIVKQGTGFRNLQQDHHQDQHFGDDDNPILQPSSSTSPDGSSSSSTSLPTMSATSSSQPLLIEANASIAYVDNPDMNTKESPSDVISSAFDSPGDRSNYLFRLYNSMNGDPIYDDLRDFKVLIDGKPPIDHEMPPPTSSSITSNANSSDSNNPAIIIGAAVGSVLFIVLIAGLVAVTRYNSKHRKRLQNTIPLATRADTEKSLSNDSKAILSPLPYSSEIVVDPAQDDVSTLGDTFQHGLHLPNGGPTEDENTASIQPDYDVMRQQYKVRSLAEMTDPSKSTLMTGPMNVSVFADDHSFEQQFDENGLDERDGVGESNEIQEVKFEIMAPAGMLGMVIDTPRGGCPIVYAIKPESPLIDKVRVGDRLISVDGEDVSSSTALQVSKLINTRQDQKRLFAFVRLQAL